MRIKNAEAGLLLKQAIVSELIIDNQLALSDIFDENSQTLDMDYEIGNVGSDDDCYYGEITLKTKIIIKINKKKCFDMRISHLGGFIAPLDAYENEEIFYKSIELNGLASLISFARANIASITGLIFCQGNIMLPMINVFKLNKLKRKKEGKEE